MLEVRVRFLVRPGIRSQILTARALVARLFPADGYCKGVFVATGAGFRIGAVFTALIELS